MKLFLIAVLFLILTSCAAPPSNEELISKYTRAPESFKKLASMIKHDAIGKEECFSVGYDHIGKYWESSTGWQIGSTFDLPLSEVLIGVGMSNQRYMEYTQLFEKTGSERVTYCQDNQEYHGVYVLMFRSGTTMGGSSAEIIWRNNDPLPTVDRNGKKDFSGITKIRNGWYLMKRDVS